MTALCYAFAQSQLVGLMFFILWTRLDGSYAFAFA